MPFSDSSSKTPPPVTPPAASLVFIVEDDAIIRHYLRDLLEDNGWQVKDYANAEDFLQGDHRDGACLVLDAELPGMNGLDLLLDLTKRGRRIPTIMITGSARLEVAVDALKAGASDFIQKPIRPADLLGGIERLREMAVDAGKAIANREDAAARLALLTPRQRQIMDLVLEGHPSKNIAADLGVGQRTIESHRAAIMRRTKVKSLPALARLVVSAALIELPSARANQQAENVSALAAHSLASAPTGDQFERFFDRIPLAVVVATMTNPERIVYANPVFEKLSGQSLTDVAGQPWNSLRGLSEQAGVELPLGIAIAEADDYAGTFRIDLLDGTASTVEAYSNVIVDDNGLPAHRLAVLVDVSGHDASDRQKFEQVLRDKDAQLQEIQHRVKNNCNSQAPQPSPHFFSRDYNVVGLGAKSSCHRQGEAGPADRVTPRVT